MLGSIIAISCALIWSGAVIMFKKAGDPISPVLLNLIKNTIGFLLMIPTTLIVDGPWPTTNLDQHMTTLLVSGFLGIGIADALVLRSLKDVGAGRLAIVETVYSPFVIVLSLLFLGEVMTPTRMAGGAMVLAALLLVSVTREALTERGDGVARGTLYGVGGIFSMAVAIVMIKPVFADVPLFWIITIRLGAAVVSSVLMFLFVGEKIDAIRRVIYSPRRGMLLLACFLSTYVSMILWVAGYKFNDAGTTAILNQMSTIFTVVLAALFLKERLTATKLTGTALAMAGVLVMTLA